MKGIKCKYCGKIYDSPSIMRTKKCHSHPKGAWCGYCTPERLDEFMWEQERASENIKKASENIRHEREEAAAARCAYRQQTPLLECVIGEFSGEPSEHSLQLRNSDINEFALGLANGINEKSRDAINTVYALRDGCDYVLNNPEAQKDGSLHSWLGEIKQLKEKVIRWDFWVALYWLTKSIKEEKNVDDKNYENSIRNGDYDGKMLYGKKVSYWISHSIANEFHVKQVIPMLRALGVLKKEDGKNDEAIKKAIQSRISSLKSTEKGFSRIFEILEKQICDGSFWGILYGLYWMQLRPTPWSDKKTWPIQ